MFGLQNLCDVRIVGLHQRAGFEVIAVVSDPEGNHCDRNSDVLEQTPAEVKMTGGVLETRFDQPEQIECLREDDPLANANHSLLVALDIAREEQRKRDDPVKNEIEEDDDTPAAAYAVEVPIDFIGKIACP